jgi:hypothetical protein
MLQAESGQCLRIATTSLDRKQLVGDWLTETVGAFAAKTHFAALLERVALGERFTITVTAGRSRNSCLPRTHRTELLSMQR